MQVFKHVTQVVLKTSVVDQPMARQAVVTPAYKLHEMEQNIYTCGEFK